MSTYSDSINYENIVHALYQALLLNEGYDNVNVQHNVTLPCRSGATAQFDIFWEFRCAGVLHRVAVECKHYNHTVGVDDVREFAYKLEDAGNLQGIMVTRKGYQAGAIKTAKASGIYLKKFQLPTDMNWDGKIRKVIITIHVLTLENIRHNFIPNKQWLEQYLEKNEKFIAQLSTTTDQIVLVDSQGQTIKTLWALENELPRGNKAATDLTFSFPMTQETFLHAPDFTDLRIDRIDYIYDVRETIEEIHIPADAILQGLLSDVDGQESFLFFLDNSILQY